MHERVLTDWLTYTDDSECEYGGGAEEHVREDPEQAGGRGEGPSTPYLIVINDHICQLIIDQHSAILLYNFQFYI
jgi:hypothetical protein